METPNKQKPIEELETIGGSVDVWTRALVADNEKVKDVVVLFTYEKDDANGVSMNIASHSDPAGLSVLDYFQRLVWIFTSGLQVAMRSAIQQFTEAGDNS